MSRIGKKPIEIPAGIKVEVTANRLKFDSKGKQVEYTVPDGFKIDFKDNKITISRPSDSRVHKTLHGTTRNLVQNIVTGLSTGFQKKLEIQGVGYKAEAKGKTLVLNIGFSHSVNYEPPTDITIETPVPTEIIVKGPDKQKVGKVAAEIRDFYPPEPYKGKGIRYSGEYVQKKQGKSIT